MLCCVLCCVIPFVVARSHHPETLLRVKKQMAAAATAADAKSGAPSKTPVGSNPPAGPHTVKNKVVLVSIDGWGVAPAAPGNAIANAKTPNMTHLSKTV